jgi:hypothetical protein
MVWLDECLERSAAVKDTDVYYQWATLEQMSEKERRYLQDHCDAARTIVGTTSWKEIITREAIPKGLKNPIEAQEPSEEELAAAATAAATKPIAKPTA